MPNADAQMAKLVDALVSGASAARLAGSSPVLGTKQPAIERLLVIFFSEQLFGWQVARIERSMRSEQVLRFQWNPRDDFVGRVLFWALKATSDNQLIVARFIFVCYWPSKLIPIATTPPLLKHCG